MSKNNLPSYREGLKELRTNLAQMLPQASLNVFDEDAKHLEQSFEEILKVNPGDKAPNFTLSNAAGNNVQLYTLLQQHKVVLVFYRGTWCPYCNLALSQYQAARAEMEKAGAQLVAISAQTPDESMTMKEKNNLEFSVLSDNGNLVANLYTSVFRNGEKPLTEMENLGFDFDAYYGNDSKEIPVPCVFIIEQDGIISFAKTEGGDYRNRTDAQEIILQLSK